MMKSELQNLKVKIAGTPQKAASLSFRYNSPKYWWFGMSANYLMDQYLDFSALNRTPNFYTNPKLVIIIFTQLLVTSSYSE